jgi:hypothetical protein
MQKRQLRIAKTPLPPIGVWERCNSQFKSDKVSQNEAEIEIRPTFATHNCKPMDSSQNALRIVRKSTDGK